MHKILLPILILLVVTGCKKEDDLNKKSVENGGPDVTKTFFFQAKVNGDYWLTYESDAPDHDFADKTAIYTSWIAGGDNVFIKIQEDFEVNSSNISNVEGKSYQVGGQISDPIKVDMRILLSGEGDFNTWDAVQTVSNFVVDQIIENGTVNGKKSYIVKGHFNCNLLNFSATQELQLSDGVFSMKFVEP